MRAVDKTDERDEFDRLDATGKACWRISLLAIAIGLVLGLLLAH